MKLWFLKVIMKGQNLKKGPQEKIQKVDFIEDKSVCIWLICTVWWYISSLGQRLETLTCMNEQQIVNNISHANSHPQQQMFKICSNQQSNLRKQHKLNETNIYKSKDRQLQ